MHASGISPPALARAASARTGEAPPVAPESLPRLLLVSDVPLAHDGVGIDRTLYSLFDTYPADKFLLYTRGRPHGCEVDPSRFIQRSVGFPDRFLRPVFTRFSDTPGVAALNATISYLDFTLRAHLPPAGLRRLRAFDPQVVVVCPNSPSDLVQGHLVARRLRRPLAIYFMDDWPAAQTQSWLGGDVDAVAGRLVRDADAWIMISQALADEMAGRYKAAAKPTFIAHNAVALDADAKPDFSVHGGTFRIVYAGSIWPMHWDAIAAVAEGCALLEREGADIEFVIHCPERFWNERGEWLGARGVKYGGFVLHDALASALLRADLLLVASSFLPEYLPYTRSSVQTKLTDYMATGRPILSAGPAGCACHEFVDHWRCGVTSSTNDPQAVAADLRRAMADRAANAALGREAYDVLCSEFERSILTNRLFRFLGNVTRVSTARATRFRPGRE